MTGGLYDSATLRDWGVVSKVWPGGEFEERARKLATRLANGPTVVHAATKQLVKAQKEGGARAADAPVPDIAGALFETEDLKGAVESLLEHGPGKRSEERRVG